MNMTILALDTSGPIASCAIMKGGQVIAQDQVDSALDHSRTLLVLCQKLLEKADIGIADIDIFAAAAGPGSFTGVRIGVSAVKGFGWTQRRPCAGVSTLFSIAFGFGADGYVCPRIKAREGEYYYAIFQKSGSKVVRVTDDAVAPESEIAALLARYPGCAVAQDGQNAALVARAALQMAEEGQLTSCHALAPSYLRKPQAQRLLEEKQK